MPNVLIYSKGLVHCSVCAHKDLTADEIAGFVNEENPTGLKHGWKVDESPTFADGGLNPHPCEKEPAERVHYLMVC